MYFWYFFIYQPSILSRLPLNSRGRQNRLPGEAPQRPRPHLLQILLEGRPARLLVFQGGQPTVHKGHEPGDGRPLLRHRVHVAGPGHDEVLER